MPAMAQIQAIREGDGTVIYALDRDGHLWRGETSWMNQTSQHVIKWQRVEDHTEDA